MSQTKDLIKLMLNVFFTWINGYLAGSLVSKSFLRIRNTNVMLLYNAIVQLLL